MAHTSSIPAEAAQNPAVSAPAPVRTSAALAVFSLWWREIVRFYRQRSRVMGVILSPLVFWVVIGSGFGNSLRPDATGGGGHYLEYFYPGALIMIVLFTSIFAMMSVIEDRREGFLLSVLVAPVSRSVIVLGKVLGGTTLATIQGLVFLVFAPAVGAQADAAHLVLVVVIVFLVAFCLTALGFAVAWRMDSAQGFHAVVNLFLIPLWLLSGALFPIRGASGWIRAIMRANPLTYGVEGLRAALFPATHSREFGLGASVGVLAVFSAIVFAIAFVIANRRSTKPAA
jgi:ABC-2 type transport system permease protein